LLIIVPVIVRPTLSSEPSSHIADHRPQDCSFSGTADFLQRLNPELVLKGDCLLRAGTVSDAMYILYTGEFQVRVPTRHMIEPHLPTIM
jgi:hypothetical protein